jgi:hypothetical protein
MPIYVGLVKDGESLVAIVRYDPAPLLFSEHRRQFFNKGD